MNILIIDDEMEIRDFVSKTLIKAGHQATTAETIEEASKLIQEKKWDLIICDIMIPHLGGFELVDTIKEVTKTPVIIMTGMDKDILYSTVSSADVILTKPFTGKELLDVIQKQFSHSR